MFALSGPFTHAPQQRRFELGFTDYERRISAIREGKVVIDGTPQYIVDNNAPHLIKQIYAASLKSLKFIIVLRDPIARAFSHFRFAETRAEEAEERYDIAVSRNLTNPGRPWFADAVDGYASFEEKINDLLDDFEGCERNHTTLPEGELFLTCFGDDTTNMLRRSMYDPQIDLWLDLFPRQDFCIISQELLLNHKAEALTTVANFIGLPRFDWRKAEESRGHSAAPDGPDADENLPIEPRVLKRLQKFFAKHGTRWWDLVKAHGYHGCRPSDL